MIVAAIAGYYTAEEAAAIIGVSHAQVCRYVRDGRLPAVKLGNQSLIEQRAVHKFERPPRGNPDFRRHAEAS